MGCKTIWVVCDESIAPILKRVCGDFVLDLAQHERSKYTNFPSDNRTQVPILTRDVIQEYQQAGYRRVGY